MGVTKVFQKGTMFWLSLCFSLTWDSVACNVCRHGFMVAWVCIAALSSQNKEPLCSPVKNRLSAILVDPRFARFRGRKEREIRIWICNLGNLSPTRAICTTASQKMTCFLLYDKLCDYTVQNLVVGSSNSDDGTYKTDKERSIKIENYLKNVGQFDPVP